MVPIFNNKIELIREPVILWFPPATDMASDHGGKIDFQDVKVIIDFELHDNKRIFKGKYLLLCK